VNSAGSSSPSNQASATTSADGGALPSPWLNSDVGAVGAAGSASHSSGVFTVRGSGADIWGNADGFQFVYQPLNGNGQIVARVTAVQNTDPWAKAGGMIRETLAAGSRHAFMALTPGNGLALHRRVRHRWCERAHCGRRVGGSGLGPARAQWQYDRGLQFH